MRKISREELNKILENHKHWWNEDCDGWVDMRADLQGADLQGADLQGAYLHGADLQGADLRGAYLQGAYLQGAYLRKADLQGADLQRADLQGAYLQGADLQGAYLQGAYLHGAYLHGADLHGAYLQGAYLQGAYLHGADLRGAYLQGTDLQGAKNIPYIPTACPDTGAFIGWKKCRRHGHIGGSVIVKLCIPEDARRTSATGRKCRCDKAVVLEVQDIDGTVIDESKEPSGCAAYSMHDESFGYKVGETVTPKEPYDECRWNECSSGIHFFINRQEAVDY